MIALYGGKPGEQLGNMRYTAFMKMLKLRAGRFHPERLPPTQKAAEWHAQRVHLQAVAWGTLGKSEMNPKLWVGLNRMSFFANCNGRETWSSSYNASLALQVHDCMQNKVVFLQEKRFQMSCSLQPLPRNIVRKCRVNKGRRSGQRRRGTTAMTQACTAIYLTVLLDSDLSFVDEETVAFDCGSLEFEQLTDMEGYDDLEFFVDDNLQAELCNAIEVVI